MHSEQYIATIKQNMKQVIDNLKPDSPDNWMEVLNAQWRLIQQIHAVDALTVDMRLCDKTPEVSAETVLEVSDGPLRPVGGDAPRPMYMLTRKLRGAVLHDIEAYVPESVIRNLELEHGDFLYAESIPSIKPGERRFTYELAKKGDGSSLSDRVSYTACPVERDGSMLRVVRSSATGELIRHEDAPFALIIAQADVQQFDLVEGDLVDVAYYHNNPSNVVVSWKYDVDELPTVALPVSKKPEPRKKGNESPTSDEVAPFFAGHTVCIVGDISNESAYKELIESRGGSHIHVEPKWAIKRIETAVKKSTVVVGLYDVSGHTGLEKAKEYCKKHKVPYKMIRGTGKTKVIQTAIELIQDTSSAG